MPCGLSTFIQRLLSKPFTDNVKVYVHWHLNLCFFSLPPFLLWWWGLNPGSFELTGQGLSHIATPSALKWFLNIIMWCELLPFPSFLVLDRNEMRFDSFGPVLVLVYLSPVFVKSLFFFFFFRDEGHTCQGKCENHNYFSTPFVGPGIQLHLSV